MKLRKSAVAWQIFITSLAGLFGYALYDLIFYSSPRIKDTDLPGFIALFGFIFIICFLAALIGPFCSWFEEERYIERKFVKVHKFKNCIILEIDGHAHQFTEKIDEIDALKHFEFIQYYTLIKNFNGMHWAIYSQIERERKAKQTAPLPSGKA